MLTRSRAQKRSHDDCRNASTYGGQKRIQPSDVHCWICLDDDDESRSGLVRDCSCRGHSGFAHVSCLVQYAEKKMMQPIIDDNVYVYCYSQPWTECPNCLTRYNNELAIELVDKYVSFVESRSQEDWEGMDLEEEEHQQLICVEALNEKLVLIHSLDDMEEEIVQVAEKVLSISVALLATPDEFVRNQLHLIFAYGAHAFYMLGIINEEGGKDERFVQALEMYQKSRYLYSCISNKESLLEVKTAIARLKFRCDVNDTGAKEKYVKKAKQFYKCVQEKYGHDSYRAIEAGGSYAGVLREVDSGIKAERLYQDLLRLSRQVHGPDNSTTISIEMKYAAIKKRYVLIKSGEGKKFEVLMREKESDSYVALQHKAFSVSSSEVVVCNGTPVICYGSLGDIRSWNEENECCEVHFEGTIEPLMIACEDIRISFDLPERTKSYSC